MEVGLYNDMFSKYIGGVFPAEIRPCFRVLCVRSSHVYATGSVQQSTQFFYLSESKK